ncbi:hypothetical protein BH09ACT10_BH09ACT10_29200 [soil metagenome]
MCSGGTHDIFTRRNTHPCLSENNFVGAILPEFAKLVQSGTITVIDGLAVKVDEAGEETYFELDEVGESPELASLSSLVARVDGLISDEDVHELTSAMGPNSTAACQLQSWMKSSLR